MLVFLQTIISQKKNQMLTYLQKFTMSILYFNLWESLLYFPSQFDSSLSLTFYNTFIVSNSNNLLTILGTRIVI